MVAPELPDTKVLDLFAGTGALGIEAISRGAASATFVERDPDALSCLRDNLAVIAGAKVEVLTCSVEKVWSRLKPPYDLVFADPPYDADLLPKTLEALVKNELLALGALVLCEHRPKEPPSIPASLSQRLQLEKTRAWGDVAFTFLRAVSPPPTGKPA